MDWNDIDRLRDPGFTVERRGYDRREVERFLASLVDWLETDAATELGELAVKRRLEYVGKATARVLVTAEEEASKLRRLTQEECAELRSEAETAAAGTRHAADEYAQKVRANADEDARKRIAEGEQRRAEIEAVVAELESRRDGTIQDLDRLRSQLSSTLGTHEPETRPEPPPAPSAKKPASRAAKAKEADATVKA